MKHLLKLFFILSLLSCSKNDSIMLSDSTKPKRTELNTFDSKKIANTRISFWTVASTIKLFISDLKGIDVANIPLDADLYADLDFEEIDFLDLISFIENEYEMSIEDQDADKIKTVNDVVNICFSYLLNEVSVDPPNNSTTPITIDYIPKWDFDSPSVLIVPMTITNQISNECLKSMVNEIINKNISTFTNDRLFDIFKQNGLVNLKFTQSTNLPELTGGIASTTIRSGDPRLDVEVKLNVNTLPNASQEYIATVVIHESIHAYLYTKGVANNLIQNHDVMWANYTEIIAGYLNQNYGTNIDEARVLATEGLQETFQSIQLNKIYANQKNKTDLPSVQREELIQKYRKGQKGKKCQK
ncbi:MULTISPECIES: acyl carrier protein [unclassified Sphingobacterium]|uniref:acyl carrier protein n=1 Tax=unclassified Sphingobacterium TaxID=2609468 RepID=UPI0025D7445E|nr:MULTISPECIES: acyl carrier protein [unclassified Sphingobacterium]